MQRLEPRWDDCERDQQKRVNEQENTGSTKNLMIKEIEHNTEEHMRMETAEYDLFHNITKSIMNRKTNKRGGMRRRIGPTQDQRFLGGTYRC